MDVRLDVKPLVERLADAIVNGRDDEWPAPMKDGRIRIKISEIIPATNSWTTKSRRNRLRNALDSRLQPHGWIAIRLNVYGRLDG
jgi:hypothetical protein